MWSPGYWAYGDDGYFWVPGTWVPVPYEGALWTPPYWGWQGGLYMFHPGYWGRHVGYYGGVNYGFGYMGIGFVGGMWRGHDFVYNTAVVHVDERFVHTTYVDRTIVQRNTIVNDRRVAFSGGPGGINHPPAPEERVAEHDQHVGATTSSNRTCRRRCRTGLRLRRTTADARAMWQCRDRWEILRRGRAAGTTTLRIRGMLAFEDLQRFAFEYRQCTGEPTPQSRPAPEFRQAPQQQPHLQQMPQQLPQARPMPQQQPRPAPHVEQRPAPQAQSRPAPQGQPHTAPAQHGESKEHEH